jgi:hypothetical protein
MGLLPAGLTGVIEIKFMAQLLGVPESILCGEQYRQHWSDVLASYLTPLLFGTVICGAWWLWQLFR